MATIINYLATRVWEKRGGGVLRVCVCVCFWGGWGGKKGQGCIRTEVYRLAYTASDAIEDSSSDGE